MASPIERLASQIVQLRRRVDGLGAGPQLAYSSIEDGALEEYDGKGNLVSIIGKQYDGTHGAVVLSGPVPPQPSTPTATPTPGGATLGWDGTFAVEGERDITIPAPLDFTRVELHVSQDAGFSADTAATLADTFESPRGSSRFVALSPGNWYATLVARASSGKRSVQSGIVEFTAEAAAAGDVSDLRDAIEDNRKEQRLLSAALDMARADLNTLVGEEPLPISVAQHLAAYTAAVMELDVSRLRVSEASIGDAVAERLLAEVVNGRRVIGASIETNEEPETGFKFNDNGLISHSVARAEYGDGSVRETKMRAVIDSRVTPWSVSSTDKWPGLWLEGDPVSGVKPEHYAGLTVGDPSGGSAVVRSGRQNNNAVYSDVYVAPGLASISAYSAKPANSNHRTQGFMGVTPGSFNMSTADAGGNIVSQVFAGEDGRLKINSRNGVEVGGTTMQDSGWLTALYVNGWTDYGMGFGGLQYRKKNGVLYIRGTIKGGGFYTQVAALPDDFRPIVPVGTTAMEFPITVIAGGDFRAGTMFAYSSGNLTYYGPNSAWTGQDRVIINAAFPL